LGFGVGGAVGEAAEEYFDGEVVGVHLLEFSEDVLGGEGWVGSVDGSVEVWVDGVEAGDDLVEGVLVAGGVGGVGEEDEFGVGSSGLSGGFFGYLREVLAQGGFSDAGEGDGVGVAGS